MEFNLSYTTTIERGFKMGIYLTFRGRTGQFLGHKQLVGASACALGKSIGISLAITGLQWGAKKGWQKFTEYRATKNQAKTPEYGRSGAEVL